MPALSIAKITGIFWIHTSCIIWSKALCRNVEYTANIGLSPALAIPAAKVVACSSAIPTSKNLFGYNLANSLRPVPSGIAAVKHTSFSFSSASATTKSPKAFEYFTPGFTSVFFVLSLIPATPWYLLGFSSASSYPLPFFVITWIRTGPSICFARVNTSFINSISCPSIGPMYFSPISSNIFEGTTKFLILSFILWIEFATLLPTTEVLSVSFISFLILL